MSDWGWGCQGCWGTWEKDAEWSRARRAWSLCLEAGWVQGQAAPTQSMDSGTLEQQLESPHCSKRGGRERWVLQTSSLWVSLKTWRLT